MGRYTISKIIPDKYCNIRTVYLQDLCYLLPELHMDDTFGYT